MRSLRRALQKNRLDLFYSQVVGVGYFIFISLVLITLNSEKVFAGGAFFPDGSARVSGVYKEFTGERLSSLSTNGTAYGVEVAAKIGNEYLGLVGGSRVLSASGTEVFLDGATERTSVFSGYLVDLFFGFTIHLIPSKNIPIRPYVGIIGVGEVVNLNIAENSAYTRLTPDNSTTTFGSAIVGGVESRPKKGKYGFSFETSYSDIRAKLFAKEKFQLGGLSFSLGVTF
ncbi:MAG: hypothetical protein AB7O96_10305 [Pseudobdellovibrionaceae bacterium]